LTSASLPTVDQTIIDGSTNAVSGNAVFDGLLSKANLSGGNTFTGNQILPSSELQVGVLATNSPIIYFRRGGITAYGTGSTTNKSFELSQGAEGQGGFSLGTNTVKMYMREGGLVGYSTPIRFNHPITSTGYVKEGGLSSQFLKADGSIDSNSYALASSAHNPVTIGTANGLSLSTQQLSLGLASSGVTGALSGTDWNTFNGKFNTPSGLTTNYLPKWNGSGFGNSNWQEVGGRLTNGSDNLVDALQVNGSVSFVGKLSVTGGGISTSISNVASTVTQTISVANPATKLGIGYVAEDFPMIQAFNIYNSPLQLSINPFGGNVGIGTTNITDKLTVNGNITASPAVSPNQVPTLGQVQAIAGRPYKVYTALLTQTGTNAPVATVLENTLGGTVTFERAGVGNYNAVSVGNLFTLDKTVVFNSSGQFVGTYNFYPTNTSRIALNNVNVSGVVADSLMQKLSIEIRVYL
jgi:hypothetical protein